MITRKSHAKVNLILRVLKKREDGYHDILSLMQRISLHDEMEFNITDGGIDIRCPGSTLPEGRENIVYKAVEALFSQVPSFKGVRITIKKNIPVAAGLGGGSSNAATALVTLNQAMNLNYSPGKLMKIGARIGADVPFFVFSKTAWASGIGDRLQEALNVPPLWFVLINPGFAVSTKDIYESLNLELTKERIKYSIHRFESAGQVAGALSNDLESVSLKIYPVLSRIKELLIAHGALGSLMSGSGPTVFGIFNSEKDAEEAAHELRKSDIGSVYTAHSI
ncbi:MAG: 4-(cytidine 5'-diphospho)-2-C-methyl-D-erythritol kinase [Deltaproteobacteria bacterium]|nr:4-(cytidine 5'-diphospho)-2-C-methyl-D-erythritol kinase [Deltaproteobacteria bacterium]